MTQRNVEKECDPNHMFILNDNIESKYLSLKCFSIRLVGPNRPPLVAP